MSCEVRILDFNYVWQTATDLTASTADASFPVANLKNQIRANTWRTTSNAAQSVVIDIKTTEAIDSVVVVFDPFIGIKFSDGAVIKIQASATDVWSSPPVDQALTIDNDYGIASHYFSSDQSYRYWRLYIDDPSGAYSYLEVPKIILTKATQLLQNPDNGFSVDVSDQSKSIKNEYGHEYSDVYPNIKSLDFKYSVLLEADQDTLTDIYERVGSSRVIAVDIDSLGETFDKDRFFIYGKFKNQLQSKHVVFSYFDSGLTIEEKM